ncbi:MAG: protein kinase [Planctomycetes bacterium]|nr:protein kinase [Planctomycetota bacterium]
MAHSEHPTSDDLIRFAQGRLDDESVVVEHVSACDTCAEFLDTVTKSPLEKKLAAAEPATISVGQAFQPDGDAENVRLESLTYGDYVVLEQLSIGGMGVVYRARHRALKQEYVVKTIKPKYAKAPGFAERFEREAQILAKLQSDYIVTVHHLGTVPEYFMAMPFLEGRTLETRLKREGALPAEEVVRIGQEITRGLKAAHDKGIIHRDLKPANLFLENRPDEGKPRVKILDFGLACPFDDDARPTDAGNVAGTPGYMAPEQFEAPDNLDQRTDLFDLGCVLYRMATGKLPFPREYDSHRKWDKAVTAKWKQELLDAANLPIPPRELNPEVPQALSVTILRLLQKQPERRFATAWELLRALDTIAATINAQPVIPVVAPKKAEPVKRRPIGWITAIALAACLACVAVAVGGYVMHRVWNGDADQTGPPIAKKGKGDADRKTEKGEPEKKPLEKPGLALQTSLKHPALVTDLAFSSDKKSLWTVMSSGALTQWDWAKSEVKQTIPGEFRTQFALTPDNRFALHYPNNYGLPLQWVRLTGPNPGIAWKGPEVTCAALSRDGKRVVAFGGGQLLVYDIDADGKLKARPPIATKFKRPVRAIAIHPTDPNRVLLGRDDCRVTLYHLEKGEEKTHDLRGARTPDSYNSYFRTLTFSPSGEQFLVGDVNAKYFLLWQTNQLVPIKIEAEGHPSVARFTPDGRNVVAFFGKTFFMFDATTGKEVYRKEVDRGVGQLALSNDGSLLATDSGVQALAVVWRLKSTGEKEEPSSILARLPQEITSLSVAAGAKTTRVACNGNGDVVYLFDWAAEKKIAEAEPPIVGQSYKTVSGLACSPNGDMVVVCCSHLRFGSFRQPLFLWKTNAKTMSRLLQIDPAGLGSPLAAAISSDGRLAVGRALANHVDLYDYAALSKDVRPTGDQSGKPQELEAKDYHFRGMQIDNPGAKNWPTNLQWSARGGKLLLTTTRQLVLFEANGAKHFKLDAESASAEVNIRGCLDSDGRQFCLAMKGERAIHLRKWDKPEVDVSVLEPHDEAVLAMAFSPDGKRLLSGAMDKTVRLWDILTGKVIAKSTDHDGWVTCVAFTPDGRYAISGSKDKTLRKWKLP